MIQEMRAEHKDSVEKRANGQVSFFRIPARGMHLYGIRQAPCTAPTAPPADHYGSSKFIKNNSLGVQSRRRHKASILS